jgi:hypothetical protein
VAKNEDLDQKIEETGEDILPKLEELRNHIKQLLAARAVLKGAYLSIEAIVEILPLINLDRLIDERDFLINEAKTYRKKYLDLVSELGDAVEHTEALHKHVESPKK